MALRRISKHPIENHYFGKGGNVKMKCNYDGINLDTQISQLLYAIAFNENSPMCYKEELHYQSGVDAYYLYACGGPLSPYGLYLNGKWLSGERIIPLSEREAKCWVAENVPNDL